MARIRVCGACWQPVASCLCDDDESAGTRVVMESDEDGPEAA